MTVYVITVFTVLRARGLKLCKHPELAHLPTTPNSLNLYKITCNQIVSCKFFYNIIFNRNFHNFLISICLDTFPRLSQIYQVMHKIKTDGKFLKSYEWYLLTNIEIGEQSPKLSNWDFFLFRKAFYLRGFYYHGLTLCEHINPTTGCKNAQFSLLISKSTISGVA